MRVNICSVIGLYHCPWGIKTQFIFRPKFSQFCQLLLAENKIQTGRLKNWLVTALSRLDGVKIVNRLIDRLKVNSTNAVLLSNHRSLPWWKELQECNKLSRFWKINQQKSFHFTFFFFFFWGGGRGGRGGAVGNFGPRHRESWAFLAILVPTFSRLHENRGHRFLNFSRI